MGKAFATVVKDWGIEDKVGSVTCDKASNNDTMITYLGDELPNFRGARHQVRCFAHTLNLTAKAITCQFEIKPHQDGDDIIGIQTAEDEAAEDLLRRLAGELNLDDGDIGVELERDDEDSFLDVIEQMDAVTLLAWRRDVKPIRTAIIKARKVSFKIINSPTLLLPRWNEATANSVFAGHVLPRDVSTRWNSTYDMLAAFVAMRTIVDTFTERAANRLRDYELDDEEWGCIAQLIDILKILKDATLFFSSNSPNLVSVIPAMDHIDQQLATNTLNNHQFSAALRAALLIGKRQLNKYYTLSDDSDLPRAAIILHPSHKLDYFRRLNWPDNWIDDALRVTRQIWESSYRNIDDVDADEADDADVVGQPTGTIKRNQSNAFADMMQAEVQVAAAADDELEHYLADSCVTTLDPLSWWIGNRQTYPHLARMALDLHTIPATSVLVEHSFSRGRILLSHLRNRLRPLTVQALMCLGDWCRQNVITDTDLLPVLAPEEPIVDNDVDAFFFDDVDD